MVFRDPCHVEVAYGSVRQKRTEGVLQALHRRHREQFAAPFFDERAPVFVRVLPVFRVQRPAFLLELSEECLDPFRVPRLWRRGLTRHDFGRADRLWRHAPFPRSVAARDPRDTIRGTRSAGHDPRDS